MTHGGSRRAPMPSSGPSLLYAGGAWSQGGRGRRVRVRLGPLESPDVCPAREQSSSSSNPAWRSSVSPPACRRGHTPASVQSRSRRQAVTPAQPTVSAGTSRHATPVRKTSLTPANAVRSGTHSRSGWRRRRSGAGGSSGATRSHRSSRTRSARTLDRAPTKIGEHKTRD